MIRPGLPLWRNGRRGRLKICWPQGRAGSSPARGTTFPSDNVREGPGDAGISPQILTLRPAHRPGLSEVTVGIHPICWYLCWHLGRTNAATAVVVMEIARYMTAARARNGQTP